MRQVNLDSSADLSENSFNHNNLPSIFAFPKDGNSWRIDWFGDIAFPNRLLRRTQPSVLVHLSRVLDTSFDENPAALLSADSTFVSKQRKVWISVGTLPLLGVGDIWRDGQLEMRPDYELEHFPDLEINSETAVLIKAGLNLEEKGFLLPHTEHPWHMQCTQSYCLMVELLHNRRLIIPCTELIRFYFGSSSNLVTKLFLPPLTRDALYSKPHFDKASGRLTLQLATNISGASSADIGRLHMDPVAWRAAVHVGVSLLKSSITGQSAYPQAYFPFEGRIVLSPQESGCLSGKSHAPRFSPTVFAPAHTLFLSARFDTTPRIAARLRQQANSLRRAIHREAISESRHEIPPTNSSWKAMRPASWRTKPSRCGMQRAFPI